jgi:hypothetical protein
VSSDKCKLLYLPTLFCRFSVSYSTSLRRTELGTSRELSACFGWKERVVICIDPSLHKFLASRSYESLYVRVCRCVSLSLPCLMHCYGSAVTRSLLLKIQKHSTWNCKILVKVCHYSGRIKSINRSIFPLPFYYLRMHLDFHNHNFIWNIGICTGIAYVQENICMSESWIISFRCPYFNRFLVVGSETRLLNRSWKSHIAISAE